MTNESKILNLGLDKLITGKSVSGSDEMPGAENTGSITKVECLLLKLGSKVPEIQGLSDYIIDEARIADVRLAIKVLKAAGEPLLYSEYPQDLNLGDDLKPLTEGRFRVHLQEMASGINQSDIYIGFINRITTDRVRTQSTPNLDRIAPFWASEMTEVWGLNAREFVRETLPGRLRESRLRREQGSTNF